MKKFYCILSILIVILQLSVCCVFAADNISFEMQNADMKPNRLFEVSLSAKFNNRLSAATFEFKYDTDFIEFRKAKAVDGNSKIQVNKQSGKIKVVFLNPNGQNVSGGSEILSLTFKTLKEGTTYIDYTVNECVDGDVNFIDVGNCTASCVRIYKNASDTVGNGNSSSTKTNQNSTQPTGKGGKSKHPTEPTTVGSSYDEYVDSTPINGRQTAFLLAGMGITAGFVVILAITYVIGSNSAKKKSEKEKNPNDKTIENKTSDE